MSNRRSLRAAAQIAVTLAIATYVPSCKSSPSEGGDPTPSRTIVATTATSFTATVGEEATVTVRVATSAGAPVANVAVRFSTTAGGGSVTPLEATTNANGEASAAWSLGTAVGENRVRAIHGQLPPVEFIVTTNPDAPAGLGLLTQPGGGRIGAILEVQPVVEIRDRYGNPVPNASAMVVAELRGDEGIVRGSRAVAAIDGVARFTDLELTGPIGPRSLRFLSDTLAEVESAPFVLLPPARSTVDRPDDHSGPQVHVIYALPSDAPDRFLDTEVSLGYSIASFQRWLAQQTGGRFLRMDTFNGAVDVTFFRLSWTDQQMLALGAFVRDEIERQLIAAGRISPGKYYMVYYDGGSTYACGGASWPPDLPGYVAAMYLQGLAHATVSCSSQTFVDSPTDFPRYWEFAMLHDMIHTLGIVSRHAPNHTVAFPAHVPEPLDLMYSGPSPWQIGPSTGLDLGGDDYFGPLVPPGAANLATSPYLTDAPATTTFGDQRTLDLRDQVPSLFTSQLPVHPPFHLLEPGHGP